MSRWRKAWPGCDTGVLATSWAREETGLRAEVLEEGREKEERLTEERDIEGSESSKGGLQARTEHEQEAGQDRAGPRGGRARAVKPCNPWRWVRNRPRGGRDTGRRGERSSHQLMAPHLSPRGLRRVLGRDLLERLESVAIRQSEPVEGGRQDALTQAGAEEANEAPQAAASKEPLKERTPRVNQASHFSMYRTGAERIARVSASALRISRLYGWPTGHGA